MRVNTAPVAQEEGAPPPPERTCGNICFESGRGILTLRFVLAFGTLGFAISAALIEKVSNVSTECFDQCDENRTGLFTGASLFLGAFFWLDAKELYIPLIKKGCSKITNLFSRCSW